MDGFPDARIRATTAKVAGHGQVNVLVGGFWFAAEQGGGGHDLAALAVPALGHLFGNPGQLHGMGGVGRKSLDGGDFLGGFQRGDRHGTGTRGLTVDVYGASAAQRHAAAVFGAGKAHQIADDPQQGRVRLGFHGLFGAIDVEGVLCHDN